MRLALLIYLWGVLACFIVFGLVGLRYLPLWRVLLSSIEWPWIIVNNIIIESIRNARLDRRRGQ